MLRRTKFLFGVLCLFLSGCPSVPPHQRAALNTIRQNIAHFRCTDPQLASIQGAVTSLLSGNPTFTHNSRTAYALAERLNLALHEQCGSHLSRLEFSPFAEPLVAQMGPRYYPTGATFTLQGPVSTLGIRAVGIIVGQTGTTSYHVTITGETFHSAMNRLRRSIRGED